MYDVEKEEPEIMFWETKSLCGDLLRFAHRRDKVQYSVDHSPTIGAALDMI